MKKVAVAAERALMSRHESSYFFTPGDAPDAFTKLGAFPFSLCILGDPADVRGGGRLLGFPNRDIPKFAPAILILLHIFVSKIKIKLI